MRITDLQKIAANLDMYRNFSPCSCSTAETSLRQAKPLIPAILSAREEAKRLKASRKTAAKEQELSFIFKSSNQQPAPVIFGKTLDLGLVDVSGERVRIKNGKETAEAFKRARIGEIVPIQFEFPNGGKLRLAKENLT
jgi:hypothetical protein